jgi:hypothetical protein
LPAVSGGALNLAPAYLQSHAGHLFAPRIFYHPVWNALEDHHPDIASLLADHAASG